MPSHQQRDLAYRSLLRRTLVAGAAAAVERLSPGQSPFVTFFSKLGVPYVGSIMNIVV